MIVEIITDGRTVWVNGGIGGECIGRFSRLGIDVHHDMNAQISGRGHCLDCAPGPTTIEHWRRFQEAMERHHSVKVGDKYMPKFLKMEKTKC